MDEAIPGLPTGVFNVISDTYIMLLPIPMVWGLHMSWQRRAKLISIFSLGVFTVAMSITRLVQTILSNDSTDYTYEYAQIDLWAHVSDSEMPHIKTTLLTTFGGFI